LYFVRGPNLNYNEAVAFLIDFYEKTEKSRSQPPSKETGDKIKYTYKEEMIS
jgi:hypothetical protein